MTGRTCHERDSNPHGPVQHAIPAKPVHWLHAGFIPRRHVTVVIGQGGVSKGMLTLDYAARMTRGDLMPGEAESESDGPMDVILIAPEDDPNESVAGRLSGAGAVLDRVHNLTVFPDGHPFSVPADIPHIATAIAQIENPELTPLPQDGKPRTVGMVILDPLLALAQNDLRTRGQARPVMEALEQVARANHLAILLTHHTNANGQAASSRAIIETSRNVITLSRIPKSPDNDPARIMTVSKTNIGMTGACLRYELAGTIEEPNVIWACELPAEQDSRGYEVQGYDAAPPDVTGSPEPVPQSEQPAGRHAKPQGPKSFMGILSAQRYRASYLTGNEKPQVIDDYGTPGQAKMSCRRHAGQAHHGPLSWHTIAGQPGMEGAYITSGSPAVVTYYGVIDRYAKVAAKQGKRAA